MKKIDIKPITILRDTNRLSDYCHQTGRPVYITKNGTNDLVVMADEVFQAYNFASCCADDSSVSDDRSSQPCSSGSLPNFGFVRVGARINEIHIADVDFNLASIAKELEKAQQNAEKIVVFPELSLTGYSCGDLFFQELILEKTREALIKLKRFSADFDGIFAVGAPFELDSKIYNVAVVYCSGQILGIVPKSYLPNYKEYYEKRQFTLGRGIKRKIIFDGEEILFSTDQLFVAANNPDLQIGVEICEDLWSPASPSTEAALNGATVILNLSASNEIVGKKAYREQLVASTSARLFCAYVYSSAGNYESSQDLVYSGAALISENGTILVKNNLFKNESIAADIDLERIKNDRRQNTTFEVTNRFDKNYFTLEDWKTDDLLRDLSPYPFIPKKVEHYQDIIDLQCIALKTRIHRLGSVKTVLGLSGGLDSTLALIVLVETYKLMGKPLNEIKAFSLPAFGTSSRTRNNAQILANALKVSFQEIDITAAVTQHFKDINQDSECYDIAYENSQARERTQILMDIANQIGGIVIGTGDLSESALGWSTYNGDHMSNYAINASIPKTLVRKLVEFYALKNPDIKEVLEDILNTPVSPELLPTVDETIVQETESIIGPYALHDFFLFYIIRYNFFPKKIFYLAKKAFNGIFAPEEILKWEKVFFTRFVNQQFKRSCMPDGPKIGSVSLSPRGDLRMPSDAYNDIFLKELNDIVIE